MSEETQGAAPADVENTPATVPADTPADQPQEATPGDDANAATTDTPADPAPKPDKPRETVQQRIDKATREKHEALRRAEAAEARAAELERQQPAPVPQAPPSEDGEPNPADYVYGETDAAFVADMAAHRATRALEQRLATQAAQQREMAARQQFAGLRDSFAAKVTEADTGALTLLNDASLPISFEMAETIFESDGGLAVANHLGANPAEARRIRDLPPHKQGYEIARLAARLNTAPPTPKTVTDAPQPPPTARGQGGKFTVDPATNDFAAFEAGHGKRVLGG
jgi:hypothetical protein